MAYSFGGDIGGAIGIKAERRRSGYYVQVDPRYCY